MHKCFYCGSDLRWNNDYDTDDVEEYFVVSMYECTNEKCKAWYEVYSGIKDGEKPN